MIVATGRIVLRISHSHSLKDKRSVVRPLIAQLQRRFQISAAEVEEQDRWQTGVIGIACVSSQTAHAESVIARAIVFLERSASDAEIVDVRTETLHGC